MREYFIKLTKKILDIILILSVIPMLWVAIYSRPFADDYGYSAVTHQVWNSTHSLVQVVIAIGKQIAEVYNTWQGSFSAIALFTVQPGIFSEKVYGVSTIILVGIFLFGNYYFIKTVMNKSDVTSIVFTAMSVILMQTLPHAIQGFYWWNGSSYYTLFYSLMLIQWGMLIKAKKLIPTCVLGFLLSGGNLITALLNLEVTFIIIIWNVINKKELKDNIKPVAVLLFSIAGFIVNAIAPGNQLRAEETVQKAPLQAIMDSFIDAYSYMNEWFALPVILLLALILPFLWHNAKDKVSLLKDVPMFVLVVLAFCLFASMFTPTEFSLSEVGPRRIQNIRYFMYVMFLVLLENEAVLRTRHFFQEKEILSETGEIMRYVRRYMFVILVGVLVLLGVNTIPKCNRNNLTSIASMRSILIGEAKHYAEERDVWTNLLLSDDEVVELKALRNHPVPIYYVEFDITGDPDNYRDESMCEYYDKKQIILLEE